MTPGDPWKVLDKHPENPCSMHFPSEFYKGFLIDYESNHSLQNFDHQNDLASVFEETEINYCYIIPP